MLDKILYKVKKAVSLDLDFKKPPVRVPVTTIGSDSCGWNIPTAGINKYSVCYLAGAGEDISFDVELSNKFGCEVLIFDPTPRARQHFDKVIAGGEKELLAPRDPSLLHFIPVGIWTKKDVLKFFSPKDPQHVSHSIGNMQKTDNYFEANVDRLQSIMQQNKHRHIDILKLDIEGAEFDVIDSMIADRLDIKIFCVEFHHRQGLDLKEIQQAIRKLEAAGYYVVSRRHGLDFSFVHESYL
jgi:FkbM family methyltransferase